jgi:hypothetical protein
VEVVVLINFFFPFMVQKGVWDIESGGTERQAHQTITNVYCC